MIPKIIHYCWFGGKPKPQSVLKYIDTWKKQCPDYNIMEWNETNYDVYKNNYVKGAYQEKKWAFVSDYCRIDVLYQYGGIYLDTDVEVLKSFDDLLNLTAFVGMESETLVATCLIASEKKGDMVRDFLACYDNLEFDSLNPGTNVLRLTSMLEKKIGHVGYDINHKEYVIIFPFEYFVANDYGTGKVKKTVDTYSVHHYTSTWLPWYSRFEMKLSHLLGVPNRNILTRYAKKFGIYH